MSRNIQSVRSPILLALPALAVLLTFSACTGGPAGGAGSADLTVHELGALDISSVVATVSGPALPAPLSVQLAARGSNGTWARSSVRCPWVATTSSP